MVGRLSDFYQKLGKNTQLAAVVGKQAHSRALPFFPRQSCDIYSRNNWFNPMKVFGTWKDRRVH